MLEFDRSTRRPRQMNLTPLVDVVFNLLIFFMVTTSFTSIESMEMSFPKAAEVKSAPASVVRVYILDEERLQLGDKEVSMTELKAQMRLALFKDQDQPILVLSGEKVTVQRLVSVMDDIYLMGGRNVSVADWEGMS